MRSVLFALVTGVAVVGLALAGCGTAQPTVNTDMDPSAQFGKYKTYAWVYRAPPATINPLTFDRVQKSIEREMATKGYVKGEPADFALAFTIGSRQSIKVSDMGSYGTYYSRRGFVAYSSGIPATVQEITEGMLIVDVYDAATKKAVWHGLATQRLNSTPDQALIDNIVSAILKELPASASPPLATAQ